MSEEFDRWLEKEYPAYLRYGGSIKVIKAAFLAGVAAQRNKMVEYIIDQGTTWTESGREVYYITDIDVAYLERMEVDG